MSERPLNFGAGPTTLPEPVLRAAQRDLVSLPAVGVSPLEASHRSGWFEGVIEEPEANLRELLQIPSSHHVVSCQGGATMQFSMAPMNLLRGSRRPAEYVVMGSWGRKAAAEARKEGEVRVAWDGEEGGPCACRNRRPGPLTGSRVRARDVERDDLLGTIPDGLPSMLGYRTYVEHRSMYNTQPVFSIWTLTLVTRWLRGEVGGLEKQRDDNHAKATAL